jgi:hypothetical protein
MDLGNKWFVKLFPLGWNLEMDHNPVVTFLVIIGICYPEKKEFMDYCIIPGNC